MRQVCLLTPHPLPIPGRRNEMKRENPKWTAEEIATFQRSHPNAKPAEFPRLPPLEKAKRNTSHQGDTGKDE